MSDATNSPATSSALSEGARSFYVTGGTLRADAPSYVEREADRVFLENLLRGEFCYVLTSRQMGKSSLMVRTARNLRDAGATVVVLDLTSVGQNLTPDQWYGGLLTRLGAQTQLEDALDDFWWQRDQLGPCQRFFAAIEQVVLPALSSRPGRAQGVQLVLFVDELDTVRSLPFSTDEFFAAIRECYTRRTEQPAFAALAFGLLGVATPSDLIRDTRLTPFNIGRRIELCDFTEAEAAPLAEALGRPPRLAQTMLRRILHWTAGHPYLTQRLCYAVATHPEISGASGVDRLCHDLFFSNRARERDDNLLFVRERLLRSEADLISLLRLYRRVHRSTRIASWFPFEFTLRKFEPVADAEKDPLVSILRLSGVVSVQGGMLRVRNRLYFRVFDLQWVESNMPVAELWRRWLVVWGFIKRTARITGTVLLVLVLAGIAITIWTRPWDRLVIVRPERPSVVVMPRDRPEIPARSANATSAQLDLTGHYNAALNHAWHPGPTDNHLGALAPGLQKFAGVTFDVRGVIQLAGARLWKNGFPERVTVLRVGQRCRRIHFLHATGWSTREGEQIANYVAWYADGRKCYIPVLYGQDVRDWIQAAPQAKGGQTFENLAWTEDPGKAGGLRHQLFVSTWVNPRPEVLINTLDFVSTMTEAAPFVVAISVEAAP